MIGLPGRLASFSTLPPSNLIFEITSSCCCGSLGVVAIPAVFDVGGVYGADATRRKGRDLVGGGGHICKVGLHARSWGVRMTKLTDGRLLGRFLAASRDRLRQLASRLKVRHLANVG
ncbi:MAG: hypothetical protein ABL921_21030 [Pirellula sp.]